MADIGTPITSASVSLNKGGTAPENRGKKWQIKYHQKWKELNVRILVLFDMMYSPYNCHCFYYLTLYDFNNKPCWLCGDCGHPMKICANYYIDVERLNKKLISNK